MRVEMTLKSGLPFRACCGCWVVGACCANGEETPATGTPGAAAKPAGARGSCWVGKNAEFMICMLGGR